MKKSILFVAILVLVLTGCSKKISENKAEVIPQRIVALSPASAEILFAIGAGPQVVAVSEYTDFPAEAAALLKVGGFDGKTLSLESIFFYKPDFVYLTAGMHDFLIEPLNKAEIRYYLSNADSIVTVRNEIETVAGICGCEKQGKLISEEIGKKVEGIKKEFLAEKRVWWEVWNSPYMTAGKSSFINDVITAAGGENIFNDIDEPYPIVSEESIIVRDPEVILLPVSSGVTVEMVKHRSGWSDISAVKNNKIFIINDNVFTRPGPRIGDCVVELSNLL